MTITVGVPLMVCPDERACTGWMCKTQGCIRMMGGIPRERNITGEMAFGEGLDSADAELAHSLKSIVTVDYRWDPHALSIIARYERDRHMAADKIAAQDRHIMHWRGSFLAEQKANEELKSRIEAQAREIAELKRDQIETERSLVFWEKRADVAEAKAARLVIQMERAKIMIGARLDAMGPALREAEVNAAWHVLNAALAEAGHAK